MLLRLLFLPPARGEEATLVSQEVQSIPESSSEGEDEPIDIEGDPTGGETFVPETTKVVEGPVVQALQTISQDGTLSFAATTAE